MPFRSMEQGISAIQQGNLAEGARLLKIALKNPELKGAVRATALVWLAETKHSRQEKVVCLQEAAQADPNNEAIRQRLSALLAADLPPVAAQSATPTSTQEFSNAPVLPPPANNPPVPPPPPATLPGGTDTPIMGMPPVMPKPAPGATVVSAPAPVTMPNPAAANVMPSGFYRTVGIVDGPNGAGTAFFVTREGLLATTRLVVGGMEQITVELEAGRQIPGTVVRSYPEYDLALIETGMVLSQLLPVTPQPTLPENTQLTAFAHNGLAIPGQRRATQNDIPMDWFPTTITQLLDVGGNPIFDPRNFLVGMLTRNANRMSSHVYGLLISTIYRCVDLYLQESRDGKNRVYCSSCGHLSQAASMGGHYCEMCGVVLPASRTIGRFPTPRPQVDALYGETIHRPCRTCGSRAGFYDGRCLRCGTEIAAK